MYLKAITCFLILFLTENNNIYISATEYVASTGKANFFQAFLYCQQANMRLAIITSSDDEARLDSYLEAIHDFENGFWLGATDLSKSSRVSTDYYWLTTGAPAIYTNWHPGEPSNSGGNEHCLKWAYRNNSGWNDLNCDIELRYVCEKNWS